MRDGADYRKASVLVAGLVTLWACEINLMKAVNSWDPCLRASEPTPPPPALPPRMPLPPSPPERRRRDRRCPWKHPVFVGVALKMVFVLVLPPALLVRWSQRRNKLPPRPLVDRRFFVLSGALSFFLLGASITWVASIPLTLAAINSALYQLYTPLTYVFSIPILRERLSISKSLGVAFALCSVLMIIFSNGAASGGDGPKGELLGDLLVLASAALYAMKGVAYKKWFGGDGGGGATREEADEAAGASAELAPPTEPQLITPDEVVRPPLMAMPEDVDAPPRPPARKQLPPAPTPLCDAAVAVGLMGFWSCLVGPLIMALSDAGGLEAFSWPPAVMTAGYLAVALMMALYMCCLYGALAYSTPTFVSVCSLFVAPVTLVWDVAAGRAASVHVLALLGIALLIGSLCLVIFADELDERLRGRCRRWRCCSLSLRQPLLHERHERQVDAVAADFDRSNQSIFDRPVSSPPAADADRRPSHSS